MSTINGTCGSAATQLFEQGIQRAQQENLQYRREQEQLSIEGVGHGPASGVAPVEGNIGQNIDVFV